ncbi:ClpX C4-type zinc finger protein [Ancylobacter sp. SL191]|uniref:ClpX C4-type zinc finger protein n=1 Tax=Ancylobacter sp. SL191 TaxID=2995166 RepID=UPI003B637DA3
MSASSPFVPHLCTFCGLPWDAVGLMVTGPNNQAICDGCIRLCWLIREGRRSDDMIARLRRWNEAISKAPSLPPKSPWLR